MSDTITKTPVATPAQAPIAPPELERPQALPAPDERWIPQSLPLTLAERLRLLAHELYGKAFLAVQGFRLHQLFKHLSTIYKETPMTPTTQTNANTTIAAIVTTLASIAAYFGFNAPPEVVNAIVTLGTGITMLLAHKSLGNVLTYCGAALLVALTYVSGVTGGALHLAVGAVVAVAGYFLKDAQPANS